MRFTFDRFELDVERRALLEDGKPIHLAPKAFTLLELLLTEAPRALSKQELTGKIWPETFVEENSLASLVTELRGLLGDKRRDSKYVRTVHGFGYSFNGTVARFDGAKRVGTLQYDGTEIPLYEGANVMGRDPSAGILIDHETVSRRHATLTVHPDSAVLEDLASKNGTFVGETRVTGSTGLEDGATFVLGDARIVFRRLGGVRTTVTIAR